MTNDQETREDERYRKHAKALQELAARMFHRADQLDDIELEEIAEGIMDARTQLVIIRPSAFLPTTGNGHDR